MKYFKLFLIFKISVPKCQKEKLFAAMHFSAFLRSAAELSARQKH
jgi:hypothetical protein